MTDPGKRAFLAKLGKAALAVAAAIKATGAHRYRFRKQLGTVDEVYRAYEHAFFAKLKGGEIVMLRPGVTHRIAWRDYDNFHVRVVPSK